VASVVEYRRLNGQPLRIELAELNDTNRIVIMYEEPVNKYPSDTTYICHKERQLHVSAFN